MRNQRRLEICQRQRDYSEDPRYWMDDEDEEEAPFAEGAEEEDYGRGEDT